MRSRVLFSLISWRCPALESVGGTLPKKLRAALGNSLVWGVAWGIGSIVVAVVLKALGIMTAPLTAGEISQVSTWFGAVGVIAGGTFSALLPIAFRGRHVLTVRSLPFLIGGAAAGALLAPFLPGSVWIPVVLGAGTASGTLAMARSAARHELEGFTAESKLPG